jgi:hypothetical protein
VGQIRDALRLTIDSYLDVLLQTAQYLQPTAAADIRSVARQQLEILMTPLVMSCLSELEGLSYDERLASCRALVAVRCCE